MAKYNHSWTIAEVADKTTKSGGYHRISYVQGVTAYVKPHKGIAEYVFYDDDPARAISYAKQVGAPRPRHSGPPEYPQYVVTVAYDGKYRRARR